MDLKIAIVGCGQIADGHAAEILNIPSASLVAVCDSNLDMARQLSERFGSPQIYASVEELTQAHDVDVIHICTPPTSHLALVRQAIAAGANVYVEKPVGYTSEDTDSIASELAAANLQWTTGHAYYYDPLTIKLRAAVLDGTIGEPLHVDAWFGYNLSGSFGKNVLRNPNHWICKLPGGLLQNNLNHLMEKWFYGFDDENLSVQPFAWQSSKLAEYSDNPQLFDEMRLTLRQENASGQFTFSAMSPKPEHFVRYYGTEGCVAVDYIRGTYTVLKHSSLPGALGKLASGIQYGKTGISNAFGSMFRFAKAEQRVFAGTGKLISEFYLSIQNSGPAPIPIPNIVGTERLMHRIFEEVKDA